MKLMRIVFALAAASLAADAGATEGVDGTIIRPVQDKAKVAGCKIAKPDAYPVMVGDLIELDYTYPLNGTAIPKKVDHMQTLSGAVIKSSLGFRTLSMPKLIGTGSIAFYFAANKEGTENITLIIDNDQYTYQFNVTNRESGPGGQGPKPLSVSPKGVGAVLIHQPVAWSTPVKRGTTVAKVKLKLAEESLVYLTADTRLTMMKPGSSPTNVWNGFYDKEEPKHLVYEDSLRINKFQEAGDTQSVSSTFALKLKAGDHVVVWNIDVIGGAEFQTQSGSLTVIATTGQIRGGEGPKPLSVKEPPPTNDK